MSCWSWRTARRKIWKPSKTSISGSESAIGVIDVKVNRIETPDEVAARIDAAGKALGPGRIKWVHPDCGFWMLKRSIADRKIEALVKGRDLYLGS